MGRAKRTEDIRNAYKILVGRTERMRPLTRPRRRWDWIRLAQDSVQWQTLMSTLIILRFRKRTGIFQVEFF